MLNRYAWLVIALDISLLAGYLFLSQVNDTALSEWVNTLPFSLFGLAGAVLLSRHPRNPVGYLVTVLGLTVLSASTLFEYSLLNLRSPDGGIFLAPEAAWATLLLWTFVLPCLVLILLLFPNGRPPAPGWKALAVADVVVTLPILPVVAVIAWRNRGEITLMETGRIPYNAEMALLYQLYDVWNLVIIGLIILALASFFFRFSRSRGIERLQLKWFVFGLSTIPASMVVEEFLFLTDSPLVQGLSWTLNIISICAFPVVMLIAVTRYRLYDIDLIIRRTLLYSALTLTLTLVYFGTVLVLQGLFTRQAGEQPAVFIVLSTLLIAALFQPLRRRFQAVIDRRFYRSKYNAEQTLDSFVAHLRQEVNLDQIERSLLAVVEETIQPQTAELWLVKK